MARTEFPRIKVTTKVAARFANLQLRNKTFDGNYIIWMTDINNVPGDTLADRVKYVGGAILTPFEAKAERNGTATEYASVYTPVYLDKDADTSEQSAVVKKEQDGQADGNSEESQSAIDAPDVVPVIPSVIAEDNQEETGGNTDTNEEEK